VWVTGGSRRRVNRENPPMRIYIIGNDGITLYREAPATFEIGDRQSGNDLGRFDDRRGVVANPFVFASTSSRSTS
jgi:hypothetical protein